MVSNNKLLVGSILVLAVGVALFGIISPMIAQDGEIVRIVTTTTQVTDLVRVLTEGIENQQLDGLMGPGVDPHLFVASAGDVNLLSQANIIFYNGLDLEGKLDEVFEQMNRLGIPTVPVTDAFDEEILIENSDFAFNFDPHIWFDVEQWQTVTLFMRDQLLEVHPDHTDLINENADNYLAELIVLDEYVTEQANLVPEAQRVLVTSHDAFNYFGRGYDFEVRGIQGASTTSEASVADIQDLADFIVERQVRAIFPESSISPQTITALQEAVRDRGFEVIVGEEIFSDAMGDPETIEGTYLGMFRHNIDNIVGGLLGDE